MSTLTRLKITQIELTKFHNIFDTKSEDASAKIALCVDEFFQNDFENKTKKNLNWKQLDDVLYTSHEAFTFFHTSFYFRMFKKTIDRLIDTGVMKFLAENYYTRKYKFERIESGPSVLRIEDLAFGFNVWLGFCCISVPVFAIEVLISKLNQKVRK